jgi:hypothetical protein
MVVVLVADTSAEEDISVAVPVVVSAERLTSQTDPDLRDLAGGLACLQ